MHPQHLSVVFVGRAPDLVQQRAVRHESAAVAHQRPQQFVFRRRRCTSCPSTSTRWALWSSSIPRRAGRAGPLVPALARRALPEPRDELIRPEGLRDVIVGTGLERADLLLLLADGGQHDDRHVAPGRGSNGLPPPRPPSGSTRSMIAASTGPTAALSSASFAVAAVVTSNPPSRRITRRARKIWISSSQTSTRASAVIVGAGSPRALRRSPEAEHEARALARQRLGPHPSAIRLQEAAPIASPSPEPAGRRRALAVERFENPLQVLARNARSVICDPEQDVRRRPRGLES